MVVAIIIFMLELWLQQPPGNVGATIPHRDDCGWLGPHLRWPCVGPSSYAYEGQPHCEAVSTWQVCCEIQKRWVRKEVLRIVCKEVHAKWTTTRPRGSGNECWPPRVPRYLSPHHLVLRELHLLTARFGLLLHRLPQYYLYYTQTHHHHSHTAQPHT